MFKKENDMAQRSNSLMKNKEIKKLKNDIQCAFPRLSEENISELIPNKGNVSLTKLANRSILYSVDDIPLFIDVLGRNSFVPTIFTLWRFPSALRCIVVHSPVSKFILRGADLMLPGVCVERTELGDIQRGEYVCVRVINNLSPFAVGTSEVSHEGIQVNGMKGKAVGIIHMYGDELWKGRSLQPNEGFSIDCIYGVEMEGAEDEYEAATAEESHGNELEDEDNREEESGGKDVSLGEMNKEQNKESIQLANNLDVCNLDQHSSSASDVPAPTSSCSSRDDVDGDHTLELILLVALKYHIKDAQLPLLASTFWSTVTKTTSLMCDIKKSRHKKVSPFLHYYQRKGLLSLTEKSGVITVTKIDRSHDLFIGINKESVAGKVESEAIIDEQTDNLFGWSNVSGASDAKMKIIQLYKLPKPAKSFFGDVKGEYGEYLKANEIRDCVMSSLTTKQYGGLLECEHDRGKVSILTKSSFGLFLFGNAGPKKAEKVVDKSSSQNAVAESDNYDNFMEGYEGECSEEEELTKQLSGGSYVAGVWIPSSSGKTVNSQDFPPLQGTIRTSVGGTEINGGQKWKPISLPKGDSSRKSSLISSSSSIRGSNKNKLDKTKSSAQFEVVETEVTIGKDELMKLLLNRLVIYTAIVQGSDLKVCSGGPPQVKLQVKKAAGNKDVTTVRGLELLGLSNELVSKDWQKLFACSVSVGTVAGIKEKEVMLQGNMIKELERCLHEKWNIPRELILVTGGGKCKSKK